MSTKGDIEWLATPLEFQLDGDALDGWCTWELEGRYYLTDCGREIDHLGVPVSVCPGSSVFEDTELTNLSVHGRGDCIPYIHGGARRVCL